MADLYVKQAEKAPESAEAGETIRESDFVTYSGDVAEVTDPSSHAVVDGIVTHRQRGPHLPEHDEDYSEPKYEAGDFPVPVQESEDGMYVMPFTPRDESLASPAIDRNDVVGVVNLNGRSVVVEEGYTADPDGDGTSTTYNRSNGNFLALGLADEDETGHGEQVQVRVKSRLQASR